MDKREGHNSSVRTCLVEWKNPRRRSRFSCADVVFLPMACLLVQQVTSHSHSHSHSHTHTHTRTTAGTKAEKRDTTRERVRVMRAYVSSCGYTCSRSGRGVDCCTDKVHMQRFRKVP
jgi:hypothetical protein